MKLTLDSDHLDDRLENGSLEVSTGWETNADDGTAWSNVFGGLLEWLLVDGNEDDCMRTETIGCGLLYISDEVLGCCKVDKVLGTKLLGDHLLLLITSVDTDDTAAHCLGVLTSNRTETTTSTDNSDPLARLDFRLLQALVDGDTGAKDRCNGGEVAFLRDAGNVSSLSNAVLLEGTIDCVPGKKSLCAERLVGLLTEVTGKTGSVDPLDTSIVANLNVLDKLTASNDNTGTLVTTDKR
jgi:hypothetical protein